VAVSWKILTATSAKRNSVESPLLRLPGEIRNMIWEYAMSDDVIFIADDLSMEYTGGPGRTLHYLGKPWDLSKVDQDSTTKPLLHVCRQIYTEVSTMIHTLSTLYFATKDSIDYFIKHSSLDQRCLITSIVVPIKYLRLYHRRRRQDFRQSFPNIKRVEIENNIVKRSLKSDRWVRGEHSESSKRKIEDWVKKREGMDLEVGWYFN
jgi:hypothetical protein